MRRGVPLLLTAVLLFGPMAHTQGWAEKLSVGSDVTPPDDVELELEQVQRQLADLRTDAQPAAPRVEELLVQRERVLLRAISETERAAELELDMLPEEPPLEEATSLADLEAVHAQIESSEDTITALDAKVDLGTRLFDQAERHQREASVRSRQEAERGNESVILFGLEAALADDELKLVRAELENDRKALDLARRHLNRLQDRLEAVERRLRLDPSELDKITQSLDAEAERLTRALVAARRAAEAAGQRAKNQGDPLSPGVLKTEAAERRATLISGQIGRLETSRTLWQKRLSLLGKRATRVEMLDWLDEENRLSSELALARRRSQVAISEILERRDSLLSEEASQDRDHLISLLTEMLELERADLENAEGLAVVHGRFLNELKRRLSAQRLETGAADLLRSASSVWTWEITAIDGRSLTVGKVLIALVVLILGAVVARRVMRRIARRWLSRVGIEAAGAAAFETLGFYVVMAGLVIFALWVAEIPLTIFTLAGGALAIGIAFGSQNILANFISGLIILAERPIKVGDMIEVDQTFGTVESIGARSTTVKTFDNIHIIVPNSTFLETNVFNWTHDDNLVRINLTVGVAYGSPTRVVEGLLLEAVTEHPKVLPSPTPIILFEDFGDNALIFQAVFWIVMRRPMDRRRTLSDLRHRIDELFGDGGIVIAFPQRDVHLDTLSPLQVEVSTRED